MKSAASPVDYDDLRTEATRFCDDPIGFFGESEANMQAISREQLYALQEEALRYRFETLADKIPMLTKLAGNQGIEQIEKIDDVAPLLFEHTMYKSYPPTFLEKNRFADINKFISRLTTYDLTSVDVSGCQSIDEWFDVMDRETPLRLSHSSGTSGTMSFLPTSKRELDKQAQAMAARVKASSSNKSDSEIYCVYPYFRSGGAAHLRFNDSVIEHIVGDEAHFIAAYPERMSSDVLYLAAKIRAAQARGDLDRLKPNPELMERLREFEKLQQNMEAYLSEFFDRIINDLRGMRLFFGGTWNLLHNLAVQGLAKGEEAVFSPDSFITSGGGAKGMVQPDNWQEDVCRFMGIDRINMAYGMSEVQASHNQCEHGHYHFSPVAIPFLVDPDTSELLPREGRVTGRACFFDLAAETRWGGFITGDEITVNWDDVCPCGRQSHFIEGDIQRYSEKRGGDDKISCAATENAHKEAMDFLTHFE